MPTTPRIVPGGGPRQGEWLTAKEAVAYLRLPSARALYQAVRRGQVPAHRLGPRRLRFSRAELDRALDSR
jgi:excisionase family DNA binding protein